MICLLIAICFDLFQCEDKIRQLEARLEGDDANSHVKELEEELRMAKEVCHSYYMFI